MFFGEALNMGARFQATDENNNSWVSIGVPVERELSEQAAEEYTVEIRVPEDVKPGKYSFYLLLYSVENPNLDYSQSELINVVIPEPEKEPEPPTPKPGRKWWLWLIIAMIVIISMLVAGLGLFVLFISFFAH